MFTCLHRFLYRAFTVFLLVWATTGLSEEGSSEYARMIEDENRKNETTYTTEKLASGIAGLVIGLYGYYNDDRGVLARVVYAATQTAGVLMIGEAVKEKNTPNFFLVADKHIKKYEQKDDFSVEALKKELVRAKRINEIANQKKMAYTAAILGGLYFYNGYREASENATLRNIYYFLGANAFLISGANFYKVYSHKPQGRDNVEIRVFPNLSVTVWLD